MIAKLIGKVVHLFELKGISRPEQSGAGILKSAIQKRVEEHGGRNATLMTLLESKGITLHEPCALDLFFYVNDPIKAEALARELNEKRYPALVIGPKMGKSTLKKWTVKGGIQCSPSEAASHQMTEDLVRMAAKWDAEYDGWGMRL
jgi:hypothetical protein